MRERGPGSSSHSATHQPSPAPLSMASPRGLHGTSEEGSVDLSDDEQQKELGGTLSERLQRLEINPTYPRFLGKSSGVQLVQSAIALKNEFTGVAEPQDFRQSVISRRPEFWRILPVRPGALSPFAASVLTRDLVVCSGRLGIWISTPMPPVK